MRKRVDSYGTKDEVYAELATVLNREERTLGAYHLSLKNYIYKEYHSKMFPKKKFLFFNVKEKPVLPEWHFIFDAICRNVPKKEV